MQHADLAHLILGSYQRLLGASLLPAALQTASSSAAASWLQHEAPFFVLAHGLGADPVFIFANDTAARCFEYRLDELIGLPSRRSALGVDQQKREQLLASVHQQGYATGYRGLRVAKSGRQFWIEDLTLWNLLDEHGVCHGQAAICAHWQDA